MKFFRNLPKFRTILLGLVALFVAFNAAFFSISGLSKLFAGAAFAVILMASSLEAAKLIAASFLHNHWNKINKLMKIYLITGITVLIIITSAGIYGFLTAAYQTTADELSILDKQTSIIELKKTRFQDQLNDYSSEKTNLSTSITDLTAGLANNVIQYKDKETGNIITTTSGSTRRVLEAQLNDAKSQRDLISQKIETLSDSVTSLDIQILNLQSNNETAAEVGPLKYMAKISGKSMDTIVNWFALLIIFVFDPLAVTLIIAFNKALELDREDRLKDTLTNNNKTPEVDKSYQVYGENGNTKSEKFSDEILTKFDEYFENASEEELQADIDYINSLNSIDDDQNEPSPDEDDSDPNFEVMKAKLAYDNGDWSKPTSDGRPFYEHPWFDWKQKKRWINNQNAIDYWIKNKNGSYDDLILHRGKIKFK
jgi:hypothetical protein